MKLDFAKGNGLVPAIVQDARDGTVLMLGHMNEESLARTRETGRVTFYSRTRGRLWTKGETSGNYLHVQEIGADCDGDTILILALADGPTCHTGSRSCFSEDYSFKQPLGFLEKLSKVIKDRATAGDRDSSYTAQLLDRGPRGVAQKVGEEAVELALEAGLGDRDRIVSEAADLVYHLLVLLESESLSVADVVAELEERHGPSEG